LSAFVAVLAIGCGKGESDLGLKAGDKLEVTEKLEREKFLVRQGTISKDKQGKSVLNITDTNEGNVDIPAGTILEVFDTPKKGAVVIEFVAKKATATNAEGVTVEVTDSEELTSVFIPQRYLNVVPEDQAKGIAFLYYTFTLKPDYVGTKLKKVD
jgi:bifunctional DNA-binding transcriptional regulator/antitoxin component of YhaV-PrlF toxin-antitoxin module